MNAVVHPVRRCLLDIEQFDPQLRGSLFCPNLYEWLKREEAVRSVPYSAWRCSQSEIYIGFSDEPSNLGGNYVIGSRLIDVVCNGNKSQRYAFSFALLGLTELPEFWGEYARRGRYALNPEYEMYVLDDEHRWSSDRFHRATEGLHKCGAGSRSS